ncbi:MAG: 1,2-phenylacetyl-CoA epoxidase subunit PaaC [Bacteroidota bacterium]|nr:phenylacetate-CoA oxygenase subunit PaaC [Candidatus Kapabacteria bacterium]MDW8220161.1 1,2-phenylacetyl-CoA epoxidase subunit PaaC [Bacteroidota bacterium]
MNRDTLSALKDLLLKMADDCLILGHRNSEWVGIGPMLEEDIAFASIAQDKLGHALALYTLLHQYCGEPDPDTLAFMRPATKFKCCHLVELPTQEYDVALVRHFLFDTADRIRFEMLTASTFEPLAKLAQKVKGEIVYHTMHASAFIRQLPHGTEEARCRIQTALTMLYPFALGIFEPSEYEEILQRHGIFQGERVLEQRWNQEILSVLKQAGLEIDNSARPVYGGRKGYHTDHLEPLLQEMSEVFAQDPMAEW